MEGKLRAMTFLMMAIGALYIFQSISNGELSDAGITGFAVQESKTGCQDSDNRDYYTRGTTYAALFSQNNEPPKEDVCVGDSLIEYYCVQNSPEVEFFECPNGCISGMCAR